MTLFTNKTISWGMKALAAFIIVASVFGSGPSLHTQVAHAQTAPDLSTSAGCSAAGGEWSQPKGLGGVFVGGTCVLPKGATDGPNSCPANSTWNSSLGRCISTKVGSEDDIGCNLTSGNGLGFCVSNLVYYVMVGLGTYFAYIGGYIFSFAVNLALNGTAYALDFVGQGWGYARDLANMSFLFILIYIAFKVMFQAETTGTIRMLVWVVVISLLVNFSFFMTRIVIDGGNIVATQFYNAIDTTKGKPANSTDTDYGYLPRISPNSAKIKDLSTPIMSAIQVQTIFQTTSFQGWFNSIKGQTGSSMTVLITLSLIYIAVGIILFIIAGSLLYASAKFIMRVAGLWVVIMAAPIAFVLAIFRGNEGGSKWFNMWLSYLIHFSVYPAVFLFTYFILVIFMNELALNGNIINGIFSTAQTATGVNSTASLTSIGVLIGSVVVRLGFVIALLYLAISIAEKVGGISNSAARRFQETVLSGAAGGLIGGLGRGIIGGGAQLRLAQQRFAGPRADEDKKKFTARLENSFATGLTKRTFDLRNFPIVGGPLRGILGAAGDVTKKLPGGIPVNFGQAAAAETWQQTRDRKVARGNQASENQIEALKKQSQDPAITGQRLEQLQQQLKAIKDGNPTVSTKASAAINQVNKVIEEQREASAARAAEQKAADTTRFSSLGQALDQLDKDHVPKRGELSNAYGVALSQVNQDRTGAPTINVTPVVIPTPSPTPTAPASAVPVPPVANNNDDMIVQAMREFRADLAKKSTVKDVVQAFVPPKETPIHTTETRVESTKGVKLSQEGKDEIVAANTKAIKEALRHTPILPTGANDDSPTPPPAAPAQQKPWNPPDPDLIKKVA